MRTIGTPGSTTLLSSSLRTPALALALTLALAVAPATGRAGPVLDRVRATGAVRVCIWPGYHGITFRDPRTQQLGGLDIELSAQLGKDLSVRVEHVDASFATLVGDLLGDRCDVAMFGVAMLPERVEHLRFTRPYLRSDIYGVTTKANPVVRGWDDIDKKGVQVGVLVGTAMETAMRGALKQASVVVIRPPATRERELESGRIDVFMTDYAYSRRLLDNADWAVLVAPPSPFSMRSYGYAVKPGDEAWWAALDGFVQRIQGDGRLAAAARRNGLSAIVASP